MLGRSVKASSSSPPGCSLSLGERPPLLAGEDDRRRSQEAGFIFHMTKSVKPAALEDLLTGLQATTA